MTNLQDQFSRLEPLDPVAKPHYPPRPQSARAARYVVIPEDQEFTILPSDAD